MASEWCLKRFCQNRPRQPGLYFVVCLIFKSAMYFLVCLIFKSAMHFLKFYTGLNSCIHTCGSVVSVQICIHSKTEFGFLGSEMKAKSVTQTRQACKVAHEQLMLFPCLCPLFWSGWNPPFYHCIYLLSWSQLPVSVHHASSVGDLFSESSLKTVLFSQTTALRYTHTCVCACACVCMCACIHVSVICVCVCVCVCMCVHVCTHVSVICVCVCVSRYSCMLTFCIICIKYVYKSVSA